MALINQTFDYDAAPHGWGLQFVKTRLAELSCLDTEAVRAVLPEPNPDSARRAYLEAEVETSLNRLGQYLERSFKTPGEALLFYKEMGKHRSTIRKPLSPPPAEAEPEKDQDPEVASNPETRFELEPDIPHQTAFPFGKATNCENCTLEITTETDICPRCGNIADFAIAQPWKQEHK